MMKRIIGLMLVLLPTLASAGACNNCTVQSLGVGPYYDNLCSGPTQCAFVRLAPVGAGNQVQRASCSTGANWFFIVNLDTESGRAAYSQLLAAKTTGEAINVGGSGDCTLAPSYENFYYMFSPF